MRLISELEQVSEENFETRFDFAPIAASQGFDFLREIIPVELISGAPTQRGALLDGPLVQVLVVHRERDYSAPRPGFEGARAKVAKADAKPASDEIMAGRTPRGNCWKNMVC